MSDEDFIRAWQAITANAPKTLTDLRPWRSMREALTRLLTHLDERLRASDEIELAELRQRAAEIEMRLKGSVPVVSDALLRSVAEPVRPGRVFPPEPIDETDAGNGVREIETNVSASDFKHELQTLRAQNVARRRRRGLEH